LDLCAGSGAWSRPYEEAGYRVLRVTLPALDVRTFQVPRELVWGVLAAPPCDQFSLARNGSETPRDFVRGMETVNACLRVIYQCRPKWWALENPVGLLSKWLGTPRDAFEPCDFGDPWTKRTALWGDFRLPRRGPYVTPLGGGPFCLECDPERRLTTWCNRPAHRAVTPAGFAGAFFRANP
jgi:site-specific DNA-cytosine methylase